ncbi:uncharacterized protein [Physcomitrium patens]|uniref:Uncharacterized protein n=2 Tax=Physcomitrium patens TaxID=3218 RepID=A0A7I4CWX9_PHYPA|nr:uncharacterized protein LOC112292877 [Physcomitrium patens]|eukprot:XP_024397575.1 uncharacterized protein LOC112292877 [Physcomitrella patens]
MCVASQVEAAACPLCFRNPPTPSISLIGASETMSSSLAMASARVAPISASRPLSSAFSWTPQASSLTLRSAISAVPVRQASNGELKVRVSSEGNCSRRKSMVLAGGVAVDGLFLLLSARSAEARTVKPEVRKKLREAIEELKEKTEKATKVVKKNV